MGLLPEDWWKLKTWSRWGGKTEKNEEEIEPIRLPELEKPENARWLALLLDTEGTMGWMRRVIRRDRIDGWRFEWVYRTLHLSVHMKELESKATIDEAARLMDAKAYTYTVRLTPMRHVEVEGGKALAVMRYIEPYVDKFRRLVPLCLTLFSYHPYIPIATFDMVIRELFGRYVSSAEANRILLRMTEKEWEEFLRKARDLTDRYLR